MTVERGPAADLTVRDSPNLIKSTTTDTQRVHMMGLLRKR